VVLENAAHDIRFASDVYFIKNRSKSVICAPIISKGEVIALIYLENNLVTAAFGTNRIELVKLLSGQIAVSLENSLLYENLEQKVVDRTQEVVQQRDLIESERQKSERLLLNILPQEIAEELKSSGAAKPRRFENVSVMFTDFVNFTNVSEQLSAEDLVELINFYYSKFDEIIIHNKLEKIKTIGDSYMCVCGLPELVPDHAVKTINAAMEIIEFIKTTRNVRLQQQKPWLDCRIGINSGPVVAGIVGIKKFAYDIWGDTVNTAARLQQNGEPGKINISAASRELVKHYFNCTFRGRLEAKNKGLIDMYFVDRTNETAMN
jgi:class 3 adenylate cyclase